MSSRETKERCYCREATAKVMENPLFEHDFETFTVMVPIPRWVIADYKAGMQDSLPDMVLAQIKPAVISEIRKLRLPTDAQG